MEHLNKTQDQMDNLSREVEILRKNKKMLAIKKTQK